MEKGITIHDGVEILLIEDNVEDAELTIRALRKHNLGNSIVHLADGAEALDFLFARRSYSHRDISDVPKLVLLDLNMPKVNGLEVLATIRAYESTKAIPVVVLTSSKEPPDINSCYALGANSYIVKPVQFDGFAKAISEVGFYWLLVAQRPA